MSEQRRAATEADAQALASGIRLRIIRLTYAEALTNKELAHRLGKDPATTLHHVRKLVDGGFLAPQPARQGNRGAWEIPYLSTGLSWRLRWGAGKGAPVEEAMLEAYLGEVTEVGTGALRQARLVMSLTEQDRHEFERRLDELLEEFHRRSGTGAERMAVYLATYPAG